MKRPARATPYPLFSPKTIARPVAISGGRIHTGRPVRVRLNPAPEGTGILFRRIDSCVEIPALAILNELLDRSLGIPLTLCIVYMEVGRRCGLRVEGVGFPGHFLCKVQLDGGELVVDPFSRGQLLGLEEIKRRL